MFKILPIYRLVDAGRCVFDLTTAWSQYSAQFTTSGFNSIIYDGRLMFGLATYNANGDEYFFDDVVLRKIGASN